MDLGVATVLAAMILAISSFLGVWFGYKKGRESSVVRTRGLIKLKTQEDFEGDNSNILLANRDTFFDQLDFNDLQELRILSHTGKTQVMNLISRIGKIDRLASPLKISVLLKDPLTESPARRNQIIRSYQALLDIDTDRDDINLDVRFYSGFQTYRAIFALHSSIKLDCFVSAYKWTKSGDSEDGPYKTQALQEGILWSGSTESLPEYLRMVWDLFCYYWGPGFIHTICFDFDDTLLLTHPDHINGWIEGVMRARGSIEALTPNIQSVMKSPTKLKQYIERLFIECNDAIEIANAITTGPDQEKVAERINGDRCAYRTAQVKNSNGKIDKQKIAQKTFPGLEECIRQLFDLHYTLSIASLTDDATIRATLKHQSIKDFFSAIVGRLDYRVRHNKEVNAKTYLLTKLGITSAIPTYRILYIGDHTNDVIASEESNCHFLEARLINDESHVDVAVSEKHLFFTEFKYLVNLLPQIEANARESIFHHLEKIHHEGRAPASHSNQRQ